MSIAELIQLVRKDMYAIQVAGEPEKRLVIGEKELQAELEEIGRLGLSAVNYYIRYPGHTAADMGIFLDR